MSSFLKGQIYVPNLDCFWLTNDFPMQCDISLEILLRLQNFGLKIDLVVIGLGWLGSINDWRSFYCVDSGHTLVRAHFSSKSVCHRIARKSSVRQKLPLDNSGKKWIPFTTFYTVIGQVAYTESQRRQVPRICLRAVWVSETMDMFHLGSFLRWSYIRSRGCLVQRGA